MKELVSKAVFLGHTVQSPRAASGPWPAVPGGRPEAGAAQFTPRQLEVLALLCEGLPNKLICRRLDIAPGTVKVHISCILRQLGVTSRLQAVVAARGLGLDAMNATETLDEDDAPVARAKGSEVLGLGI